ncbi:MAG: hypothetical protein HFJ34_07595 [Clostridia bacterium]|nr:hypothetical protein [Clostridia bacterium]
MKKEIFNNFTLTDEEVMNIIDTYQNLIKRHCKVSMKFDEDLYQEIVFNIFKTLTRNR